MKQELKITVDVPDGYKAYWNGHNVVTVDIECNDLPNTWEEFCKKNPIKRGETRLTGKTNFIKPAIGERKPYDDGNVLPNLKAARQHRALMQLHQLRDCYRQGWTPDWNDQNVKFAIERALGGGYNVDASYNVPAFLSFQSRNIAGMFLSNFWDLIREAEELL